MHEEKRLLAVIYSWHAGFLASARTTSNKVVPCVAGKNTCMCVKDEVKARETRDSCLALLGSMCAVEEFLSLVAPDSLFS